MEESSTDAATSEECPTAVGEESIPSGEESTAVGEESTAAGEECPTAAGEECPTAVGEESPVESSPSSVGDGEITTSSAAGGSGAA